MWILIQCEFLFPEINKMTPWLWGGFEPFWYSPWSDHCVLVAGSRRLLQEDNETVWDDAREGITSAVGQFWGGQCVSSAQCTDYIATCSSSIGQTLKLGSMELEINNLLSGECRPVWWMWMILASLVLSLLVSCICCICCGICSCIKDCICCCRWFIPRLFTSPMTKMDELLTTHLLNWKYWSFCSAPSSWHQNRRIYN